MEEPTDQGGWRSTGVVAWTDRDGPGRPPRGPSPWLATALGAGLVAVFTTVLVTDTLCPEHRIWVQALASVALVGTAVTAVGLFRGWATAPLTSVIVTSCGMGIGLLDSVHAAERGRWIAVAFGALWLGSLALAVRSIRLLAWDRSLQRSVDAPHDGLTEVRPAGVDAAAPQALRAHARPPARSDDSTLPANSRV